MADRDELLALLNAAIVPGEVTLSSGKKANWYLDLRQLTLSGRAAPLAGRLMLELVADWNPEAVGGLTLGADPIAAAMLHASGGSVDAFVVRKTGKAHGLQRRIEGPDVAGRRVVALEDTSTTGASVLQAVEALREAGADIAGVAVLVDRGAGDAVRETGLDYRYVYTLTDLALPDGASA